MLSISNNWQFEVFIGNFLIANQQTLMKHPMTHFKCRLQYQTTIILHLNWSWRQFHTLNKSRRTHLQTLDSFRHTTHLSIRDHLFLKSTHALWLTLDSIKYSRNMTWLIFLMRLYNSIELLAFNMKPLIQVCYCGQHLHTTFLPL